MEISLCIDAFIEEITVWSKNSLFIYPMILSLLSALIFWLVFLYFPNEIRKRKIRPVIELDILNIRNSIFSIFDSIMMSSKNGPSFFQNEIRSGLLSRDDIWLGLQNKCLNESYLYDHKIHLQLLIIGDLIYKNSKHINYLIDKVFNFSQFVCSDEILLLEKIREELRKYDYGEQECRKNAEIKIKNRTYYPASPNLHYRINNFVALYDLFIELQNMVISKSNYIDRGAAIYNVQFLYGAEEYNKCKSRIKKYERLFPIDSGIFKNYSALCEFKLGNKERYYNDINSIYKDRPYKGSLSSSREFLNHLLDDNKAIEILSKYHSKEEIQQLAATVAQEKLQRENYIKSNMALSKYFHDKRLEA